MIGQYNDAIKHLEKSTQQYPTHLFSHLNLAACYILAGREQQAYEKAKEVYKINPKFTLDQFAKTLPLKKQEEKNRFIGALKKAGLK